MSKIDTDMFARYKDLVAELRIIAKWFQSNHGGPDVNADDVGDAALRSLTHAMIARRTTVGEQIRDIELFALQNNMELPE